MNQSDIRAMKQRMADRHDAENAEPFWVSLVEPFSGPSFVCS
jgi:hypothetical protein